MRRDDYENELKSQPNETKAESTKRYQANSFVNKDGTEAKATAAHQCFLQSGLITLFAVPSSPSYFSCLASHRAISSWHFIQQAENSPHSMSHLPQVTPRQR